MGKMGFLNGGTIIPRNGLRFGRLLEIRHGMGRRKVVFHLELRSGSSSSSFLSTSVSALTDPDGDGPGFIRFSATRRPNLLDSVVPITLSRMSSCLGDLSDFSDYIVQIEIDGDVMIADGISSHGRVINIRNDLR